MKRKALGVVLLLSSIVGVSAGYGTLFAQYYVPVPDPNSEMSKTDQLAQALAAQLRGKPDAAKEAELKKLVEESFAKRHAAQVAEAKALAEKLAKLQELLKKREEKKAEIVARRIKQLLGEADDLDWNLNPTPLNPNVNPLSKIVPDAYSWSQTDTNWNRIISPSNNAPETTNPKMVPPGMRGPAMGGPGMGGPSPKGGDVVISDQARQPATVFGMAPNLSATPKTPSDDLKTLELEVALAKTRLKEAVTQLEHYTKGESQIPEQLDKHRFAVEKLRLEVDLAVRRLEIARERKDAESKVPSPAP